MESYSEENKIKYQLYSTKEMRGRWGWGKIWAEISEASSLIPFWIEKERRIFFGGETTSNFFFAEGRFLVPLRKIEWNHGSFLPYSARAMAMARKGNVYTNTYTYTYILYIHINMYMYMYIYLYI